MGVRQQKIDQGDEEQILKNIPTPLIGTVNNEIHGFQIYWDCT